MPCPFNGTWLCRVKEDPLPGALAHNLTDGSNDSVFPRADVFLERRAVRDGDIEGRNAADRGFELIETCLHDTSGDFRRHTATLMRFIHDHNASGFLDRCHQSFEIEGYEGPRIDDFDVDLLRRKRFSSAKTALNRIRGRD